MRAPIAPNDPIAIASAVAANRAPTSVREDVTSGAASARSVRIGSNVPIARRASNGHNEANAWTGKNAARQVAARHVPRSPDERRRLNPGRRSSAKAITSAAAAAAADATAANAEIVAKTRAISRGHERGKNGARPHPCRPRRRPRPPYRNLYPPPFPHP